MFHDRIPPAVLMLLLLALLAGTPGSGATQQPGSAAPPTAAAQCGSRAPAARLACYRQGLALVTDSARARRGRGDTAGAVRAERAAALLFQRACDAGEAAGCSALARMLESGLGDVVDQPLAVQLYRRACDLDGRACNDLAYSYRYGVGVEADLELASQLYFRACEAGNASACYRYAVGRRQELNPEEYAELLERYSRQACDSGSGMGCFNYSVALRRSLEADSAGLTHSEFQLRRREIMALRESLCEQGNNFACTALGDQYVYGWMRTQRDTALAMRYHRQACEPNDPARDGRACAEMGLIIRAGAANRADSLAALELFRSGCAVFDRQACANVGLTGREMGDSVVSLEEQVSSFRFACESGHASSCYLLGVSEMRRGNVRGATAAYRAACELNEAKSCRELGNLLEGEEREAAYRRACALKSELCSSGQ